MKKIGMIVAVEMESVMNKYGELLEILTCKNYQIKRYRTSLFELYVLHSGSGQIAAASGTQFLISEFQVQLIINFGIVGGLTPEMSTSKTCIVKSVIHYDFDTSSVDHCEVGRYLNYEDIQIPLSKALIEKALQIEPSLKPVICASGDKFIASTEQKQLLQKNFGADIVEMEAAGIVLTCDRNEIPCMMIKTVSDSLSGGAEEFQLEVQRAAAICIHITDKILQSEEFLII